MNGSMEGGDQTDAEGAAGGPRLSPKKPKNHVGQRNGDNARAFASDTEDIVAIRRRIRYATRLYGHNNIYSRRIRRIWPKRFRRVRRSRLWIRIWRPASVCRRNLAKKTWYRWSRIVRWRRNR